MLTTVLLVAATYLLPVAAMAHTGLAPAKWTDGTWALAGRMVSGPSLGVAIAVAGMVSSGGMLLTLVMSYSRLPLVLAQDGYLPSWLAKTGDRTGAPWVALLVSGALYAACLGLGFRRLVQLDVIIYGGSLALEFIALVVLRVKEPATPRPFRVPGGLAGAIALGVVPMALLILSLFSGGGEESPLPIVGAVAVVGVLLFQVRSWRMARAARA
jgi:amino acid transporter